MEGDKVKVPIVAIEVSDSVTDAMKAAKDALSQSGAKRLCVRVQSAHPDFGKRAAEEVIAGVRKIADAVKAPLIIVGCGDDEIDNEILPDLSQAFKGKNYLFGIATQTNYKTLTATCLADSHSIIAESPIDVNIAKQLNILISDMGFPAEKIVMHPTTASLGYGMEYVYSIMERARLAASIGDKMLAMPFIVFVGQEVWRVKEANESVGQGINWEIATAVSLIQAGADIIVMKDAKAAKAVGEYIDMMRETV